MVAVPRTMRGVLTLLLVLASCADLSRLSQNSSETGGSMPKRARKTHDTPKPSACVQRVFYARLARWPTAEDASKHLSHVFRSIPASGLLLVPPHPSLVAKYESTSPSAGPGNSSEHQVPSVRSDEPMPPAQPAASSPPTDELAELAQPQLRAEIARLETMLQGWTGTMHSRSA